MNITDGTGCNQQAVPFENQNVLDTKIDKLTAMMTKWHPRITIKPNHSNPRSIQGE